MKFIRSVNLCLKRDKVIKSSFVWETYTSEEDGKLYVLVKKCNFYDDYTNNCYMKINGLKHAVSLTSKVIWFFDENHGELEYKWVGIDGKDSVSFKNECVILDDNGVIFSFHHDIDVYKDSKGIDYQFRL